MQKNIGAVDRNVRFLLGAVLLVAGVIYQSWWGVLGLVPIATAAIGFCPLYVPLGISTEGQGYGTHVGYVAAVKPDNDGNDISV